MRISNLFDCLKSKEKKNSSSANWTFFSFSQKISIGIFLFFLLRIDYWITHLRCYIVVSLDIFKEDEYKQERIEEKQTV